MDSFLLKGRGTSTWPSKPKKIYGNLGFALLVPIKYLSLLSAVVKFWHKEAFELDLRT